MNGSSGPKLTAAGKIFVFLFVAACLYGAYVLFLRRPLGDGGGGNPGTPGAPGTETSERRGGEGPAVEIGIAYGTEKERWLERAAADFAKAEPRIKIDLIPLGSLEGAQAVLGGDTRIHVWSPASSLYKDTFLQEWQVQRGGDKPFLREEDLALSPMAFVMWAERHAAFTRKYGEVSFQTLAQALAEPAGWQGIAGRPEWGLFKLGHTHPNESNSGLMTLVLMAGRFLDFLLSEPVQKQSLVHGFRPGNPAVPVRFAGSPFLAYQRFGLSVDLGSMCEPPKAEVLNNLLQWWQRSVGSS